MIKRGKGRRIAIAPAAILFFVGMLLSDRSGICAATVLAAAVHETGHLLAARWMRIPLSAMRLELLGARIEVGACCLSYGQEWLLAAAGPLFSLLASAALAPLWQVSLHARLFSCASALLGAINLLPVTSFDGGRMTEVLLSRVLGVQRSFCVMYATTFLALLLLWTVSVYFLLRIGGGLSMFCFSMSLFSRFLEEGKIA